MLHLFRNKNFTNVIYGIIIASTVLVFAVQFGPSGGNSRARSLSETFGETCSAKVHGNCIDPRTLRAAYRLLTPRGEDGPDADRARSMGLGRIALNGLIERELLVHEARRVGLGVSEDEVTDSIFAGNIFVSIPSDNPSLGYYLHVANGRLLGSFRDPKNKFDMKSFERTVQMYTGRSLADYREWQSREILASKMRELVRAPVRVSDSEAFERYQTEKSTAALEYVEVDTNFIARYLPEPSQAELDAWGRDEAKKKLVEDAFAAKKAEYLPQENHVRHVLVKVSPAASDADKQSAARRMLIAKARLAAGASFASVAEEFSEDTSASRGGDVGPDTSRFVESFKLAANALTAGQVTPEPVESSFGWHLIAKDDPSKAAAVETALRRDLLRTLYLNEKAAEAARTLTDELNAKFKAGADDAAIEAVVAAWAANHKSLPAGTLTLARLEENETPAAEADAGAAPAAAPRWTKFEVAVTAAGANADPDRPLVKGTGSFNRGGDPISMLSGENTMALNEFAFGGKPGDVRDEPFRAPQLSVVVRLKEQKTATRADFDKEASEYLPSLLEAKRMEALGLYVRRLRDKSKGAIQIFEQNGIDDKKPAEDED